MKKYSKFVIIFLIMLFPMTVYAGCPLGASVTADLAGILKVMRILAPIIVIGYSFVDGIKALINKDIDGQSKAVYSKFIKRLAAAVFLFVIPVLVDLLMQVMNVWDETGHCTIDDTGNNSAEVSPTNGSGSASADKLTSSKNGANADKLSDKKDGASADKLSDKKDGSSADKLGNDKNVSADGVNNTNKASADDINPKDNIIVIGN